MAHGRPDWSPREPKTTTYAISDIGEAVMRLGAISPFDRRGEIYLFDSFENGLGKWVLSGTGSGYGRKLETDLYKTGGFSQTLISPLGPTDYVWAHTCFPCYRLSKYGYEYSFLLWGQTDKIDMECRLYDGTNKYRAIIRYDFHNKDLYYYDSAGNWQIIDSNLNLPSVGFVFNTAKIVIDWENKKYIRVILNSSEYDLSAYDIWSEADARASFNQFILKVTSTSSSPIEFTFDDFILTINEP